MRCSLGIELGWSRTLECLESFIRFFNVPIYAYIGFLTSNVHNNRYKAECAQIVHTLEPVGYILYIIYIMLYIIYYILYIIYYILYIIYYILYIKHAHSMVPLIWKFPTKPWWLRGGVLFWAGILKEWVAGPAQTLTFNYHKNRGPQFCLVLYNL